MLSHFPTWSVRKPERTRPDVVCKVGGAPIGWSRDWPVCALCNLPMSFLGQFTGDPLAPRLPAGHTLFLFTCERDLVCDFWNPVAKANACVLIPHDELGARPTPVPEEHLRAAGTVGERLGEQGRRLHRTVQLDDDAASIANFCLDGIGFVMTHAGDPGFYFMINR